MFSTTVIGVLTILVLVTVITPPHLSYSSTIADLNQTRAEAVEEEEERIVDLSVYKNNPLVIVSVLANELETKIRKSGAILDVTSRLSEVRSTPFADSISPELHGIPADADAPKREIAQDILAVDKDLELIFFVMPNGDMYLEEPYSRQENLTRNNFAFRDYYIRAIETRSTYLSDVIVSASSGRPQANIAVPMYSEQEDDSNNNSTLVGLWAGGLNLTRLSESLLSLNLTSADERVVYVDGQGQKFADSDSNQSALLTANTSNASRNGSSFADLQAFRNAINGQSGSTTEIVNGTTMLISYHPVKAFSNVWAVLYIQQPPSSQTVDSGQRLE